MSNADIPPPESWEPCPWPLPPSELFPGSEDVFWHDALVASEGLEDFGIRFFQHWFIKFGVMDCWMLLTADAKDYFAAQPDGDRLFEQWIRDAMDAFRFHMPLSDPEFAITAKGMIVLRELSTSPHTVTAVAMEGRLDADLEKNLDRKTIGLIYRRLQELGFIRFPEGARQGAMITKAGRDYLARWPESGEKSTPRPPITH